VGGRGRRHGRGERELILAGISDAQAAGARLGTACKLVGISARTVERWRVRPDGEDRRYGPQRRPGNALSASERAKVTQLMSRPPFAGLSPKQMVPLLADEGIYLASESTMYRLRRELKQGSPRPIARTDRARATTVHQAKGPNQVWSWDITYLPTTVRGRYFYLYLVMDVWSRRVVGWQVHESESADHAAALIVRICEAEGIDPQGLVLHSDNGTPMRGNTMLATLQWLGIIPSFSRPHVCDDNPYSEALFRTLKQAPSYPSRPFLDLLASQHWVAGFVRWYNGTHRHSAIRYVTPDERHFGRDLAILAGRHELYERARRRRPERWSRATRNWTPIGTVVLNPQPASSTSTAAA
jgi:putative transposase